MIQIGCTAKLLDYLGLKSAPAAEEREALFGFSANLLTLNRRKCIAVMNDESCCGFIIYGVKASDKNKLQQLLEDGLRNMLASENVQESVIDRYISDCSFPALLCKTANRTSVARLNKFCERIKCYEKCYDSEDLFQTMLLPLINDDVKQNAPGLKNFFLTYEEMEKLLRQRYGQIFSGRFGVFDISLRLNTPCVRRVKIPMDFSLFYLHDVIQQLFLWKDEHLHMFVLKQSRGGKPLHVAKLTMTAEDHLLERRGTDVSDERIVRLDDVFTEAKSIVYIYDFGDGWTHDVKLLEIVDGVDAPCPVCTEITGDAPPEDCGGPDGFAALQRMIADARNPGRSRIDGWPISLPPQKTQKWINVELSRRYLGGAFLLYYSLKRDDDY